MIYDTLENLGAYRGISTPLDHAIDYLANADITALEVGTYPVEGDEVIVHIQSYDTKDASSASYEAHRDYIDIQITLEGEEHCWYTPLEGLSETVAYDGKKDIGFYDPKDDQGIPLKLVPGMFCILFPQDAHKPCCTISKQSSIRKAVVKVRA